MQGYRRATPHPGLSGTVPAAQNDGTTLGQIWSKGKGFGATKACSAQQGYWLSVGFTSPPGQGPRDLENYSRPRQPRAIKDSFEISTDEESEGKQGGEDGDDSSKAEQTRMQWCKTRGAPFRLALRSCSPGLLHQHVHRQSRTPWQPRRPI